MHSSHAGLHICCLNTILSCPRQLRHVNAFVIVHMHLFHVHMLEIASCSNEVFFFFFVLTYDMSNCFSSFGKMDYLFNCTYFHSNYVGRYLWISYSNALFYVQMQLSFSRKQLSYFKMYASYV